MTTRSWDRDRLAGAAADGSRVSVLVESTTWSEVPRRRFASRGSSPRTAFARKRRAHKSFVEIVRHKSFVKRELRQTTHRSSATPTAPSRAVTPLDALDPLTLQQLVRDSIESIIDDKALAMPREESERAVLAKIVATMGS